VDGEDLVTQSVAAASLQVPYPIQLGYSFLQNRSLVPTYLAGGFDEVRLWSVALTSMQIQDSMHHQLTNLEAGLLGHWTFDSQSLAGSCPLNPTATASGTGIAYVQSPLDFAPIGEPYLVTQAQLMQDYTVNQSTAPATFTEISGYRVMITARDSYGNPCQTNLNIWTADPDDTADLILMDGSTVPISYTTACSKPTDANGEFTFVINANGALTCPSLKVNAAFMEALEKLVISPDRHVHATLSRLTGDQLTGDAPLPNGNQWPLANIGSATSGQLNAAASAIAQVMSAAVDHNLQPQRPLTRTTDLPEDVSLIAGVVPRYESLDVIVDPYDFQSNAVSTHFLAADASVTRILVAESMANAHWSFDYAVSSFTPLTLEARNQLLENVAAQHLDQLSAKFDGQASTTLTAAELLALAQGIDNAASRQARWFGEGFLSKVASAATVVMTTGEAVVEGATGTVNTLIVTAIDAAGDAYDSVLQTVEDAVNFVGAIITRIGATVQDVVTFIQTTFNWGNITAAADVISGIMTQVPAVMQTVLTQVETQIENALTGLQSFLDGQLSEAIQGLGANASTNALAAGSQQSPPGDLQSKYVRSMYTANVWNASDPNNQMGATPSSAQSSAFTTSFSATAMSGTSTALTGSQFFTIASSPNGLLGTLLADFLSGVKAVIDAAIAALKTAVGAVFSLISGVIDEVFALATKRIEIPILTDFYEGIIMGGTGTFSLLGVASLLAAIPFTFWYNLFTGPGPVFSAAEVAEISAPTWLSSMYAASGMSAALGGQTAAAALEGRSPTADTPQSPTTFQKACQGMSYVFIAATGLWGFTCVLEDTLAIANPNAPQSTILFAAKVAAQAITDVAAFPAFTLPAGVSTNTIHWAVGLYVGDLIQLYSNWCCLGSAAWAAVGDPIVTGSIGLAQLVGAIGYSWFAGGNGTRQALNYASNIAASFEWIPQLLKYDHEPTTQKITQVLLPVIEGAAYTTVALTTLAGTIYGSRTGN
jgi:hypothetical protein